MPNTTNGYPYPADTDPIAQGAAAIQGLAGAIDTRVRSGTVVGVVSVTFNNGISATAAVTFPAGRFLAGPAVTVPAAGSSGFYGYLPAPPTVGGCTVALRQADSVAYTGTISAHWHAGS
jgi:hypothetical protein